MTERHLIAYFLILLLSAGICAGVYRWRRAIRARRYGRRFGSRRAVVVGSGRRVGR